MTYHFNYYAFDGKSGAVRWRHEDGDFQARDEHDHDKEGELAIYNDRYVIVMSLQRNIRWDDIIFIFREFVIWSKKL